MTTGNVSANLMTDEEGTGAANIRGDTSRRSRSNQLKLPSARSGSNKSKRSSTRKRISINVSRASDDSNGDKASEGKGAIFYKKR